MHLILASLMAVLAFASAASAQSNTTVTAHAYAPIPDVAAVTVVPKQDTDLNQRLTAEFERTLQNAGYVIAPGGIEWHFDTTVSSAASSAPPIELFGSFGNRSGSDDFGASFRLPFTGQPADRRANTFRLLVELKTPDEALVWAAVMSSSITRLDRFSLGRRMVPEFVAIAGEQHDRVAINLD